MPIAADATAFLAKPKTALVPDECDKLARRGAKSPKQAAEFMGISEREVWRLIERGVLRTFKYGDKRRLIPTRDCEAVLSQLMQHGIA